MYRAETMDGAGLIRQERLRQEQREDYYDEHDDQFEDGELARAGAAYALHSSPLLRFRKLAETVWPWDEYWKPKTPLRDLVRAGALIAAEIDRRLRAGEEASDGR